MIGAYWYFFDRPGVPKIDMEVTTQVLPFRSKTALVRIDLKIKNLGSSILKFDKDDYGSITLMKISPLTKEDVTSIEDDIHQRSTQQEHVSKIAQVDTWPVLAKGPLALESSKEAGETDHLYFRSIVPCETAVGRELILATQITIPKVYSPIDKLLGQADERYEWIAQDVTAPFKECPK